MRKVQRMKEEGKNRQPKGSFSKVGTARFPSRMALRAGGQSVRLLHGRGAQASRLCMAESEATSSTGLALHCSTRPGRPCPILKQQGRPRRQSGTPAARHPYPFFSKGAAAPFVRLRPPSFPSPPLTRSLPLGRPSGQPMVALSRTCPASPPCTPCAPWSPPFTLTLPFTFTPALTLSFHLTNPKNSL